MRSSRPYHFLGQTTSLCEDCLALVPAKIIAEGDDVFFQKRCPRHGVQKTLVSDDLAYWKSCRDFIKPGDLPLRFQTRIDTGCPYDCGLCPDHEQHSCLALIEVAEQCNLRCPVCFADSGPHRPGIRPLDEIERMLDALVASEGEPDLVQISGGEPTLHPQILDILRAAKRRPIRHLMLNTNGLRLASDGEFVEQLKTLAPGFEVYLQFDSLKREALERIRGADLRRVHEKALERLDAAGISTTLVATMIRGVNDGEAGDLIRHGIAHSCVRGVTFQPAQDAGRNDGFAKEQRMVLSQIRRAIIAQSDTFEAADLMPLPCNPEAIAVGYGLRVGQGVVPVSRHFPRELLVAAAPNAITFESRPELRAKLFELLSLSCNGDRQAGVLQDLLCCLPQVEMPAGIGYDRVFRIAIVQFLDRFNFCLGGVKRSCVHFVTPDGRIIPFDTYNLFHRAPAAEVPS